MIQRIQSVFLLLLALSMLALMALPIWEESNPQTGQHVELSAFNLTNTGAVAQAATTSTNTILICILAVISAGIALYEIFQFKSRLTQMKLGMLNTLVIAGTLIAVVYYAYYVGEDIIPETEGKRDIGFYVPFAALVLNALSNRFISRDEKLVRSVDRLR